MVKVLVLEDEELVAEIIKDFIEGVMPGVNLDIASKSLQQAVKDTFEEMKLTFVQRNWMEIVAAKP